MRISLKYDNKSKYYCKYGKRRNKGIMLCAHPDNDPLYNYGIETAFSDCVGELRI